VAKKETIALRVPPDTHAEFERYREERSGPDDELSKSDAGRRLLERGLDYERGRITPANDDETDEDEDDEGGGLAAVARRLPDVALALVALSIVSWLPLIGASTWSVATTLSLIVGSAALVAALVAQVIATAALFAVNRPLVGLLPSPLRRLLGMEVWRA
jgi:hypothetical protein